MIIASFMQKGGSGKTSTVVNLGAALALRGKRVLLVDYDPQMNLTTSVGVRREPARLLSEVLLEPAARFGDTVTETSIDGLHMAPGDAGLAAIPNLGPDKLLLVLNATKKKLQAHPYDVVLIDLPPGISLLTASVLNAAQGVLAPVTPEKYCQDGVAQLLRTLEEAREMNGELRFLGFLISRQGRYRAHTQTVQWFENYYGEQLFRTRIPEDTKVREAAHASQPVVAYAPDSRAATSYRALADELLPLLGGAEPKRAAGEPQASRRRPRARSRTIRQSAGGASR
jgi:chromosome partitioning protein